MQRIVVPSKIQEIFDMFESAGLEISLTGGAVRDLLLGLEPVNWDFSTNASDRGTIRTLVSNGYMQKINRAKSGTVELTIDGVPAKISTYGIKSFSKERNERIVRFLDSLEKDLSHRDFTINSLAYNTKAGLIDLFGGLEDLENRTLRTVGVSRERFKEDNLRVLRAIRMAMKYSLNIEPETFNAMAAYSHDLHKLNRAEIREEFFNCLVSAKEDSKYLDTLFCVMGVLYKDIADAIDFEQNNKYHIYDLKNHILKSIVNVQPVLELRLAMFFHDLGKVKCKKVGTDGMDHFIGHASISHDIAKEILNDLETETDILTKVLLLIKGHDESLTPTGKRVSRLLNKYGEANLKDLIAVQRADIYAQNPDYEKDRVDTLIKITEMIEEEIERRKTLSLKDLEVNGEDLSNLGFSGIQTGKMLNMLLQIVRTNSSLNNREFLLSVAVNHSNIYLNS